METLDLFRSDIFCTPPTQETLAMARELVSSQISPQNKRLLNNWIQFIAEPCLLPQQQHKPSSNGTGGGLFFGLGTSSSSSTTATATSTAIGDIDASTQHLIDMQWEKIYIFPAPYGHRVLPRDTIKSSLFGKIYRGYLLKPQPNGMLQLDKEVCLKMSNLTLSRQGTKTGTKERVFEDALQELECLRVLSRFSHPNIIPLLMHGQLQKQKHVHLVLVFPLARCSLADKMRLNEVTLETIHRVRYQIGGALLFLHSLGFAHRDVSLENICELWGDPTNFVLIDFGLAKRQTLCEHEPGRWKPECLEVDPATGNRFLVGKLRYLGPEFFLLPSDSAFDLNLADVFSFGVCLMYMAIQSFPYQNRYASEPQTSVEWRLLWSELHNDHFVRVCESIPPMAWLGALLYLNPLDRAGLKQVLFPL